MREEVRKLKQDLKKLRDKVLSREIALLERIQANEDRGIKNERDIKELKNLLNQV